MYVGVVLNGGTLVCSQHAGKGPFSGRARERSSAGEGRFPKWRATGRAGPGYLLTVDMLA